MFWYFQMYRKLIQLYIHAYIYIFFLIFLSIMVYYKILNIVPCATQ